ncbi:MAG: hypothetical protein JJV96_01095 [Alphaproteobacteria bacterium]|nr:hypothetical protein [Alphaproteobacteria bacterium]
MGEVCRREYEKKFSHSVGSSIGWGTFLKSLQIILQTGRNNKRYFIITPRNNNSIS